MNCIILSIVIVIITLNIIYTFFLSKKEYFKNKKTKTKTSNESKKNKTKTKFPKKFIEKKNIENFSNRKKISDFKTKTESTKIIENTTNTKPSNSERKHKLIFYSKNYCGLCEKINKIWNNFLNDNKDKHCNQGLKGCRIDNHIIEFIIINCDNEEFTCYNVNQYPLIVLEKEDGTKKIYNNSYNIEDFQVIKQWMNDNL